MQGMTGEGNFGCHFNPAVSLASKHGFLDKGKAKFGRVPILCRQSHSLFQCTWVIPARYRHHQSFCSRLHLAVCCFGWPHEDAGSGPAREAAPAACLGACELVGFSSCACCVEADQCQPFAEVGVLWFVGVLCCRYTVMLHLADMRGATELILAQLFASVLAAALVMAVVGLPLCGIGTILMLPLKGRAAQPFAHQGNACGRTSTCLSAPRCRSGPQPVRANHAAEDDARDVPSRVAHTTAGL